jgi:hypothetical protein
MKVCECGCGQRVLVRYGVPLRFIHGHQNGDAETAAGLAGGDGRVPGP